MPITVSGQVFYTATEEPMKSKLLGKLFGAGEMQGRFQLEVDIAIDKFFTPAKS